MVYSKGLEAGCSGHDKAIWKLFAQDEHLSEPIVNLFQQYSILLQEWNTRINLTRIESISDIIAYHFQDSLAIRGFIDFAPCRGIVDVGSGAGFPGIPLAILYSTIPIILIEVNTKKLAFLNHVKTILKLDNVVISNLDWRTFIRTTQYNVDYIFARASLQPEELVRAFRTSSAYQTAVIVYWASRYWHCPSSLEVFFKKEEKYAIKGKKRRYIFFSDTK